jgi:Protein of unknown function (DUF3048) N-terminal domain/Protein of unknown function (DUF3048) C-terminal domain
MSKQVRAASLVAMAALLLSGCTAGANPQPTPSYTPKVYVNAPLTGMPFEEGTRPSLDGPSVTCKIDNVHTETLKANINRTDLVYVELVEGGLTRLVAVWHSDLPTAVGPVRSIRPMDPDIISPLGGIVCYSGGQLKFVTMMRNTNVYNATETSEQTHGTFTRAKDREAPKNVIVDAAKLAAAHAELTPPAAQFEFTAITDQASAVAAGKPIANFSIYYPSALSHWIYNGTNFARSQDGIVHKDSESGLQTTATNVVVLNVQIDRQYGKVPKTILVGSGTGWVFSQGKQLAVKWSKASQTEPIVLTDEAGAPIKLIRGNTWVELLPQNENGRLEVALPLEDDTK